MGKPAIILPPLAALLLLGAVPISASTTTDTVLLNSAKLHLRRATSDNIIVYIPCESQGLCSLQKLEYKTKLIHTSIIQSPSSDTRERVIRSLVPNTTYVILATVKFNSSRSGMKSVISKLTARTCSEAIPKVSGPRVVKAGPGWIDVRWKPVEETTCYSDIFYLVNYYSNEWLHLGVFRDNNNTLLFRPSHPCDAWPGEFCALLADHVTPGKKHTIEIKTARYRWGNETAETSPGGVEKIIATSNAQLSGPYDFGAKDAHSPCAPPRRPAHPVGTLLNQPPIDIDQGKSQSNNSGIHLPLWGLLAAGLVLIAVLVFVVFAIYCGNKRRKRESSSNQITNIPTNEFPHVSRLPMSHQTKNFDQNQPLPAPRVSNLYDSNIYDDCRDVPRATTIYEQLREPPMKPKAAIAPNLMQGCGSSSNCTPPPQNFLPHDVYVPMGPPPPLYDDAQGVTQIPENVAVRPAETYVQPRQLPTYNEIMEADTAGPEYNRPYSTFTNGKWKAWN